MDYGTVEFRGKELKIIQQPYLENDGSRTFYKADAEDEDGDGWTVYWYDLYEGWQEMEDESDTADWTTYEVKSF